MPRRGNVPKREILPDPVYGSVLVTRLVNSVMLDGKKGVAQKVVYDAFDEIKDKTGKEPVEVFNQAMENVKKNSGHSKFRTFFDMIGCTLKYGAGYNDYMAFGFWDLTDKQRATYVTRVVSKKLVTLLNDDAYSHFFDDKEEFCQKFAEFVRREQINFRTASKDEVRAFVEKYPVVFQKPAHGSCGNGCTKHDTREYESFDAFYDDMKEKVISRSTQEQN